jgi:hypothetical protein
MIKYRGLRVFIDGDNELGVFHPGQVLGRAGNAAGDIELGCYGGSGYADLVFIVDPVHVDQRPRGADGSCGKTVGKTGYMFKVLRFLYAPAGGNATRYSSLLISFGTPISIS